LRILLVLIALVAAAAGTEAVAQPTECLRCAPGALPPARTPGVNEETPCPWGVPEELCNDQDDPPDP
jgi:hypothetical protein